MADVPVGPAVARSRSIGGRLNSAPGQLRRRQTDESMIEVALARGADVPGVANKVNHLHTIQRHIDDKSNRSKFRNPFRPCSHSV